MKQSLFLLCLLGLLAACNGLLPKAREPDRLFVLNAPAIEAAGGTPAAQSLEIMLPQAASGLASDRIALLKDTHELDYFAGARWADSLPAMTQSLMVETFEKRGSIKTVGNDVIGLAPTLRLVVELRSFQAVYGNGMTSAPDIRINMVAKLFREPGHRLLSSKSYEESAKASSNQMAAIIPAFDEAFGKATHALVEDVSSSAVKP